MEECKTSTASKKSGSLTLSSTFLPFWTDAGDALTGIVTKVDQRGQDKALSALRRAKPLTNAATTFQELDSSATHRA